jgi:hypothetical protein
VSSDPDGAEGGGGASSIADRGENSEIAAAAAAAAAAAKVRGHQPSYELLLLLLLFNGPESRDDRPPAGLRFNREKNTLLLVELLPTCPHLEQP